ncbi:MAG: 50S ribosomal protein L10 [Candidatus Thermoplasmatota archaeon]|nr:50S ribosomal protein L10 [Candidatus Thermoplasmatota archaeon]
MAMVEVSEWKIRKVEELTTAVTESPVVAIADVKGIPAPQLQHIRQKLRGRVRIMVSKKSLIQHSLTRLSDSREGIEQLVDSLDGQVAFVLTDLNPFKLFKEMESTKTKAPARGGEVSPEDILVKEGDTPFKPGPIMSELQRAGLPASIERGKVVIKKDTVLVKEGEKIPKQVAQVLTRLEIYPIIVGLNLTGVYENGLIFSPEDLRIDDVEFMSRLSDAIVATMNLAMFIHYVTDRTVEPLIVQAEQRALNVAMASGILTKKTAELLLQKAHGQMLSLSSQIPDALDDELTEKLTPGKKREPEEKPDEKKEEEEVSEEETASDPGAQSE